MMIELPMGSLNVTEHEPGETPVTVNDPLDWPGETVAIAGFDELAANDGLVSCFSETLSGTDWLTETVTLVGIDVI